MSKHPGYWTQAQLIAWIMYQDLSLVMDIGASDGNGGEALINEIVASRRAELEVGKKPPLNKFNTLGQATHSAIVWLFGGNTQPTGFRNGRGDRVPVPTTDWLSLKFSWMPDVAGPDDPNRIGGTTWHGLLFSQADAIRRWPTEDDMASAGGQQQMKAAAPFASIGTIAAIEKLEKRPRRGCLNVPNADVDKWAMDKYIPLFAEGDEPPTVAVICAALRDRFDGILDAQTHARRIRHDLPSYESWHKQGRPSRKDDGRMKKSRTGA